MNRIIMHWTGGTDIPNSLERLHYHRLVDGKGNIHYGKFKPEDNINCYDGKYAEHTGGGNTGAIGWALCGMLQNKKTGLTIYPIVEEQVEAFCKGIAEDCKKYKIPATPQSIMTHREFGLAHPKTKSAGKPDINQLSFKVKINGELRYLKPDEIGNYLRNKISWYLEKE